MTNFKIAHFGARIRSGELLPPTDHNDGFPFFSNIDITDTHYNHDSVVHINLDGQPVYVNVRTFLYISRFTTNGIYNGRMYYRFNPHVTYSPSAIFLIEENEVEHHLEIDTFKTHKKEDLEIGTVYMYSNHLVKYIQEDYDGSSVFIANHTPNGTRMDHRGEPQELIFGIESGTFFKKKISKGLKMAKVLGV